MIKSLFFFVVLQLLVSPLSGQEEEQPKGYDVPVVCNVLLPGFGAGSFLQGDWVGGTIQLTTQLIGLGCFGAALALSSEGPGSDTFEAAIYCEVACFGISGLSRLFGFFRPLCYADEYNTKHQIRDEARQKSSLGYVILNVLFPGFGVGSFIQGDRAGGIIQLLGEAFGLGCFGWYVGGSFTGEVPACSDVLWIIGYCLVGGARFIWGPFRPIWYASRKKTEPAADNITFGVTPSLIPSADHRELVIGLRVVASCAID